MDEAYYNLLYKRKYLSDHSFVCLSTLLSSNFFKFVNLAAIELTPHRQKVELLVPPVMEWTRTCKLMRCVSGVGVGSCNIIQPAISDPN